MKIDEDACVTFFTGESYRNAVTCYEIPGVHSMASSLPLPLVSVRFVEEKKSKRFRHESCFIWQCSLGYLKNFLVCGNLMEN